GVLLAPAGVTVRVADPVSTVGDAVVLFLVYAVILAVGWLVLRAIVSARRSAESAQRAGQAEEETMAATSIVGAGRRGGSSWRPTKTGLVAAALLMLVGPSLLLVLSRVGPDPRPSNAWAFPAAGAVFAAGWVLVGASLRPAGSAGRGAAAAAVAYVVVGLLWV